MVMGESQNIKKWQRYFPVSDFAVEAAALIYNWQFSLSVNYNGFPRREYREDNH